MEFPGLGDRLRQIQETVAARQERAGWSHPVTVVAVTKTFGPDAVRAAAAAGLRDVGENRVQEALQKQERAAEAPVAWHLIGTLQRNKARNAAGRFALIHSVDREDLARDLDRRVPDGERQPVLLQVNCSGEPQKGGVEPDGVIALLDRVRDCLRLEVRGLMTMSAYTDDEREQRRAFQRLRGVRDRAVQQGYQLPELSMGMSGDFPAAVEEGATIIRIGTLLFGERPR